MGLYITGLGMLLAIVLAIYAGKHFKGNIYLAAFLFLFNLQEFSIYALHVSKNPVLGAISLFHFAPFFFLIGPAFYLYIRSIVNNSALLYKKDIWHLLPVFIILLVVSKFYFQDFAYKITLAKNISHGMNTYLHGFYTIIPQAYINLLRAISIFCYVIYAIWIFYKKLPKIKSQSELRHQQRHNAELWLTITFICTIVLSIIYLFASIQLVTTDKIIYMGPKHLFVPFTYLVLNVILIFYPQILYGLPSDLKVAESKIPEADEPQFNIEKIGSSSELLLFTEAYINEIRIRIENIVNNQEYCNQDFSRLKLSVLTNIPSHHLSYYFSNILNVKFTDWRNQLRIEYAKRLIESDLTKTLTLDAIASNSGFGNRQNFIAAFKKNYAMTPSEYINSLKIQSKIDLNPIKSQKNPL